MTYIDELTYSNVLIPAMLA